MTRGTSAGLGAGSRKSKTLAWTQGGLALCLQIQWEEKADGRKTEGPARSGSVSQEIPITSRKVAMAMTQRGQTFWTITGILLCVWLGGVVVDAIGKRRHGGLQREVRPPRHGRCSRPNATSSA